jgi:general stress protein YciG
VAIAELAEEKTMETVPKLRRGFAAMSPERVREIAKKGGASVPNEKRAFSKDKDLAAEAGRKGGNVSRRGGRPTGV